jgi:isopentenyl-diphosphate delta-isomerase
MMDPKSGLYWSPWFKLIVDNLLVKWWADLEKTLNTNDMVDLTNIHRF